MQQYTNVMNRIIDEGQWIENERTGKRCKTLINVDLEYDFCPLVTTRQSYWKSAVAEFVGYLKGYSSAADFRLLGTKTWDANANENEAWLDNSFRTGEDDMGRVYGVQGRNWRNALYYRAEAQIEHTPSLKKLYDHAYGQDLMFTDQVAKVAKNLSNGIDDRGEIITFWNPGEMDRGCLRPCIHTHTFSLVNGTLHLTSYQRSADWPLGVNFNMVQLHFFLLLMAQMTGNKPGKVYHKIVNAHIYEDQYEIAKVEAARTPMTAVPVMTVDFRIKSLADFDQTTMRSWAQVDNYEYHPALKYPFSV